MPVTDVAIDKIKDMIITGELAPGDRLPKEAELAQHLGLSRSSLREAVKALCLIRVLDVRQGDGTYVTSLEPGRRAIGSEGGDHDPSQPVWSRDGRLLAYLVKRGDPLERALSAPRIALRGFRP